MRTKPAVLVLLLLIASPLFGNVKLPAIIGDHMVLQRDTKVPIWGWADPSEAITVTAGDIKATATAGTDGKWTATLDGLKASDQPIDLTIAGKNTITLHDVLIGDVWVCSGQSNMEFQLGGGKYGFGGAHNAADEIPKANLPTLRLFIVKKKIAFDPQTDCTGSWQVCTPDTAPRFSAVGYFFGRDIQDDQHVPVGMIGTYWGGTPAEAWTSLEALEGAPALATFAARFNDLKANLAQRIDEYRKETLPKWQAADAEWKKTYGDAGASTQPNPAAAIPPRPRKPASPDQNPNTPTVLTNGMIAPIIPYAIKGAIWYQGEANAGAPKVYQTLFPTMITDWRTRWNQGDFPFIWVQLASYDPHPAPGNNPVQSSEGWPGLREAQLMTLKLPNTGEAVTIDIGQANDIHPKDKSDVGARLALAARHVAYGEDVVYSGPTFDSLKVDGASVQIKFKNIGSGLTIAAAPSTQASVPQAAPADHLEAFSIAGADHKFVWASAQIDGDTVTVISPDVHDPQAVRYAWANNPKANLYNKEGLPASPFRTDDWGNPAAAGPK